MQTLGVLGAPAAKAAPALAACLQDEFLNVRGAAAETLGKLGVRAGEAVPSGLQSSAESMYSAETMVQCN